MQLTGCFRPTPFPRYFNWSERKGRNMRTAQERFEAKFEKGDGCWNWKAGKQRDGYGQFRFAGRHQRAHRVSWMLYVGEIPDNLQVLHHCDNPSCVNPSHLFLGTIADNAHDRDSKGRCRGAGPGGERHGGAKLTEKQVAAIRERRSAGARNTVLAKEFNVAQQTISSIVCRRRWAKV